MIRLVVLILVALIATACGDSPSSPSGGAFIQFRLDTNSCGPVLGTQTVGFTFFVDGIQVGGTTLGVGQTSPSYATSAGSHIASASVTNTTIRFGNLNFTVSKNQTFTYLLLCS